MNSDDGNAAIVAQGLPEPRQPTKAEVARHNLTHLPYRSWCPHCLAARRPNAPHRSSKKKAGRSIPVFVADYCFVRKPDEDLLTGLVGKLYDSCAIFASICDVKGPDDHIVDRLADFFKSTGLTKVVYKNDQEPAIRTAIEAALLKCGRSGEALPEQEVFQMVPENSAVGESPSNGRAERAVQMVEDMMRTYLSALESRLKCKIPTQHPVMRWLFEHAGNMLNRFTTNPNGLTPYAALHGRNPVERHVEFGEKVFYYIPKRARSKLCLRWRLGIYLGCATNSNECYVANVDGDVLKSRSVARVVADARWDADAIQKVKGMPGKLIGHSIAHAEFEH